MECYLFYAIYSSEQSIWGGGILEGFFTCQYNGYLWFFIPLFAFYLSVPIIGCWIKLSSYKEQKVYLLMAFILLSLIPSICRWFGISYFKYSIFPMAESLILYPVLGYFLIKWNINKKMKEILYLLGFVSSLIHFGLLYYSVVKLGDSHRYQNVLEPTSIIMAITVLVWCSNQKWDWVLSNLHIQQDFVIKISSCSLGIFLVQAAIFMISIKLNLPFHNPYVGALLTYITSLLIIMFMKRIPFLRIIVP